ncbi:MAG: hypothetical protein QM504_17795, partial [Pseudomonadota bacterium]
MYITAKVKGITVEHYSTLDGKECPYVLPNSKKAKSLTGITLISKDLLYAKNHISLLNVMNADKGKGK